LKKKIEIKKSISVVVIIIAKFLIVLMIIFIFAIIFKNNKMSLEKQTELKIKEDNKVSKLDKKTSNYAKVSKWKQKSDFNKFSSIIILIYLFSYKNCIKY